MGMQKGWGAADTSKKSGGKATSKTVARKPSPQAVAVPSSPPSKKGGSETIEIRAIENGYIIRKSSYNDKPGGYKSSEYFSAKKPDIGV